MTTVTYTISANVPFGWLEALRADPITMEMVVPGRIRLTPDSQTAEQQLRRRLRAHGITFATEKVTAKVTN